MYISFYEFLNEGRKSLLSDDERVERDMLFKLGKKKRSQEQEKRYKELVLKSSGIENSGLINTGLGLDDFVDFNKIDLYSEYEKMSNLLYNKGIFGFLLPNIPIKTLKYKKAMAHVNVVNNQLKNLTFNTTYKVTYGEFLGILAHECIHVLMAHNKDVKNQTDYHGVKFKEYMNKINNANLGFIVTLTYANELIFQDIPIYDLFVIVINSVYKGMFFYVTKNQKVIDDFKQHTEKHFKDFGAVTADIYKTNNPYFKKFKITNKITDYLINYLPLVDSLKSNLEIQTELLETIAD